MQRGVFLHEVGLPGFLHERGLRGLGVAQKAAGIAQVQHPHHVVDAASVYRHPGMAAGAELLDDGVDIVFQVDAEDIGLRHHDVVHRGVLKIQDRQQHAPALEGEVGPFVKHGAELLRGKLLFLSVPCVLDKRSHDGVGGGVQDPHEGV